MVVPAQPAWDEDVPTTSFRWLGSRMLDDGLAHRHPLRAKPEINSLSEESGSNLWRQLNFFFLMVSVLADGAEAFA